MIRLHVRLQSSRPIHTGCCACELLSSRQNIISQKNSKKSFSNQKHLHFYNSAISEHVVQARIVVEMGSHPTKRFLFNHTTPFSTKGLKKSLCDFTGTIFVQCENPVRVYLPDRVSWFFLQSASDMRAQFAVEGGDAAEQDVLHR